MIEELFGEVLKEGLREDIDTVLKRYRITGYLLVSSGDDQHIQDGCIIVINGEIVGAECIYINKDVFGEVFGVEAYDKIKSMERYVLDVYESDEDAMRKVLEKYPNAKITEAGLPREERKKEVAYKRREEMIKRRDKTLQEKRDEIGKGLAALLPSPKHRERQDISERVEESSDDEERRRREAIEIEKELRRLGKEEIEKIDAKTSKVKERVPVKKVKKRLDEETIKRRRKLQTARYYEITGRFDEAIIFYEELGMYDEADRVRKIARIGGAQTTLAGTRTYRTARASDKLKEELRRRKELEEVLKEAEEKVEKKSPLRSAGISFLQSSVETFVKLKIKAKEKLEEAYKKAFFIMSEDERKSYEKELKRKEKLLEIANYYKDENRIDDAVKFYIESGLLGDEEHIRELIASDKGSEEKVDYFMRSYEEERDAKLENLKNLMGRAVKKAKQFDVLYTKILSLSPFDDEEKRIERERRRKQKKLKLAMYLEKTKRYEKAAVLYKELGLEETAERLMREASISRKLRVAKYLQDFKEYERAADIYEELNMPAEAKYARRQAMKFKEG